MCPGDNSAPVGRERNHRGTPYTQNKRDRKIYRPAAGHSERCRRATDGSRRLNGLNAGSFQRSDEDRSPTLHQRLPARGTGAPFDTPSPSTACRPFRVGTSNAFLLSLLEVGQFLCRFEGQFLCRLTLKIVYLSLARCTYSGPMEWERIPLVEVVDWERALNACLKAETRAGKGK